MKKYAGHEIPGMIEVVEQILLENLAENIIFEPGDAVVEFGTFFGRSTACLSAGLEKNPSFTSECKFNAYDSFECDVTGGFFPYVAAFAKNSGIEHLIKTTDGKVNFMSACEHYLQAYLDNGILSLRKAELHDSHHQGGNIRILHIDSPKFYNEFKVILFRFFPHLREGSIVVFQDFFYQWSASIIAVCGLMIDEGILIPMKTAASSLVCQVAKKCDPDHIAEIELKMENGSIPDFIDCAMQHVSNIEIDRAEVFWPRLMLSKFQWLFEQARHRDATEEFLRYFNSGGKLNRPLVNDFIELMRHGFSIRRLYEKDHRTGARG